MPRRIGRRRRYGHDADGRADTVFQLFDGVQAVANGALRGAGDVRVPFAITSAAYWFVATPVALALGFGVGWGALGLWWGLTLGLVLVAVLLTLRFERIARRKIERVR
jgi:MATE family multidrug resistance protein